VRRADHSSRGVLPSVVCLIECDCEASIMRRPWPTKGCYAIGKKIPDGEETFFFYAVSRLALGPIHPLIQWIVGGFFPYNKAVGS
jgi:hypothetical protein